MDLQQSTLKDLIKGLDQSSGNAWKGRKTHRPKLCEYNNEANSRNTLSDKELSSFISEI